MSLSQNYHEYIRPQSIAALKGNFWFYMNTGQTTNAAYYALAIARKCGAYMAQRIIGPQIRLVVLLRIVWLDTSKTYTHACCQLRYQAC